jgi:hypothetical protein
MKGDQIDSRSRTELSLQKIGSVLQHVLLLFLVALGPLALSGCTGLVSSASTTGNPPQAPAIQVDSTSINFGNEVVGSSLSQALIITNTGTATLTITQVTETGSAFSVSGFSLPLNVSVGQHITITVAFRPTAVGTASGNISIVSNASGSPASVSLSGTGVAPVHHSVVLSWNASTSTVAGYSVYRSTLSGGPYTRINSSLVAALNYTDSTVQSGTKYYFVTTAVDSSVDESMYSNEVSATVP